MRVAEPNFQRTSDPIQTLFVDCIRSYSLIPIFLLSIFLSKQDGSSSSAAVLPGSIFLSTIFLSFSPHRSANRLPGLLPAATTPAYAGRPAGTGRRARNGTPQADFRVLRPRYTAEERTHIHHRTGLPSGKTRGRQGFMPRRVQPSLQTSGAPLSHAVPLLVGRGPCCGLQFRVGQFGVRCLDRARPRWDSNVLITLRRAVGIWDTSLARPR